jgi:hypothetical protein
MAIKKIDDVPTIASCSSPSSTYQLDQVLELVRLRVEVVDQEGLELLCGGSWLGNWARAKGARRKGEKKGGRERRKRRRIHLAEFAVEIQATPILFSLLLTSLQRVLVEGRHAAIVRA